MKPIELIGSRDVEFHDLEQIRRMLSAKGIPVQASFKFIPGITAPIEYGVLDIIITATASGFLGAFGADIWRKLKSTLLKVIVYLRGRPQFQTDLDPDIAVIFGDGKKNAVYVQIPTGRDIELPSVLEKLEKYLKRSKAKRQWIYFDKSRSNWKAIKSVPERGYLAHYGVRDASGVDMPDYVSVHKASRWSGLSQGHIRYLLRTGTVKGKKINGKWFLHLAFLESRIKNRMLLWPIGGYPELR